MDSQGTVGRSEGRRWLGAGRVAAAAALVGLQAAPVAAVPRLDLNPYPAAAPGENRWVIQLPGVLNPAVDGSLATDPRDWRVRRGG